MSNDWLVIWAMVQFDPLLQKMTYTYKLFECLHPNDTMKLSTNPTYHMLNDGIQHLLRAHLSMCWEEVTGKMDLHKFADKKLTWEEIKDFAQKILD